MMTTFSSCFDVTEDISLNKDGSGNATVIINLSQSKDNISSYVDAGEINGNKIPGINEIEEKMAELVAEANLLEGISNVESISDYEDYIFTFTCEFENVYALNDAINIMADKYNESGQPTIFEDNYGFDISSFYRYFKYPIPDLDFDKLGTMEKFMMDTATFTGIYRFEDAIDKCTNSSARISKSGKSTMLKATIAQLVKKQISLENEVIFEGDRLEPLYEDVAGQWTAIWLTSGSKDHEIKTNYHKKYDEKIFNQINETIIKKSKNILL